MKFLRNKLKEKRELDLLKKIIKSENPSPSMRDFQIKRLYEQMKKKI